MATASPCSSTTLERMYTGSNPSPITNIYRINVDANLIDKNHKLTRTDEKVIALSNGCICCTLRADLVEELVRLVQLFTFDYIVVESSGISEPEQVAEMFDERLTASLQASIEDPAAFEPSLLKSLQTM